MNIKKTVRIGTLDNMNVFCKIELKDGKLSISGVEGPMPNGDARGSCGQIIIGFKEFDNRGHKSISDIAPAPGWTTETVKRFFEVWDKWHLNDMRAGCEHQTGPDWTSKDVTIYHFRLTAEASKQQDSAKKAAVTALKQGTTFTSSSPEQTKAANLDYSVTHYAPELPKDLAPYYEPKKPLYNGDKGATETKQTGWLNESEHPEGFLSKACPVCGYKYGSQWRSVEVPADVVEFLASLPVTDKTPAWV